MSFHDELVQARRQPVDAEPEAPPTPTGREVTFAPVSADDGIPLVCSCGALVPASRTPAHADWHRRAGV